MAQYGFYFDKEKCIGCRACEIACQLWNGAVQTVKWRNVVMTYEGTFPEISSVNVSLACMHCADAPCQKACPRSAISKDEMTGLVTVNQKSCVGCMLCLWACPFGAPQLGIDGVMEKCTFCEERPLSMKRACEEICPTQAIITGPIAQLSEIVKQNVSQRLLLDETSGTLLGHGDMKE